MNRRRGLAIAVLVAGVGIAMFGGQDRPASLQAGPTQAVSDDPQQAINVNTSPVIVADPRRPGTLVVASRVDAPHLQCHVSASTTGGEAWRRLDLPLAPGADNCFWPDLAFDPDGNLLVLYTPTGGPFNLPTGLWLQRFTTELAPDGPPVRVSGPLTFEPRLAVEGRRVVAAWIQAGEERATKPLGFGPPPNPLVVARSDDGGRTFARPVTVSEPSRLAVQPALVAGPGGRVVVGALDLGNDLVTYQTSHEGQPGPPPPGPWRVVAWTSADGGATFGPPATVADGIQATQRVLIDLAPAPAFALDSARGRLYATWESGADVVLSRSDDAGHAWSPPTRLGPAAGAQFLPGLGVAPDGRVDVAFYDRSHDPDDILAQMVVASSTDGGATFTSATVSDHPFDSIVGSFNGDNVMLGSHLAVASLPGSVTVVWPDTGRGNRVNNIVDLLGVTVAVHAGQGRRLPVAVLGGVLAMLGAVLTARPWPGREAGRGRSPAPRRGASPPPTRRG